MKNMEGAGHRMINQKLHDKRKPAAACKNTQDSCTKSGSIFEYKGKHASCIASEIVNADLINHGYRITKTLGEGAYAKVKLADVMPSRLARNQTLADIADGGEMQVAIKIISKKVVPKDFLKKFLPREMENHSKLPPHDNILRLFEHFSTEDHVYMVLEYCPKGDLLDLINRHIAENQKGIGEELSRKIFIQICNALQHAHNHGIVHRDLKCENILLDKNLDSKLTDFGFSCLCERDSLLKTSCGSYAYTAPEVIRNKPYDGYRSDLWSLGILLFAMVNGRLPFNDGQLMEMEEEMKMQRLRFERTVTFDCMVLIRKLLQYHPNQRPALGEVLDDPWISGKKPIPRQINKPKWINPYTCNKKDPPYNVERAVTPESRSSPRSNPICYKAGSGDKQYASSPTRTVTVNQRDGETVTLKSRGSTGRNAKVVLRPNTWPKTRGDQKGKQSTKGPDVRYIAQLIADKHNKIGDSVANKKPTIGKHMPMWFMYKILESERKTETEKGTGDVAKKTKEGIIHKAPVETKKQDCPVCTHNGQGGHDKQKPRMSSSAGKAESLVSESNRRHGFPVRQHPKRTKQFLRPSPQAPVQGSKKCITDKSHITSANRGKSAPSKYTAKPPPATKSVLKYANIKQVFTGDSKKKTPPDSAKTSKTQEIELTPLMGHTLLPTYFPKRSYHGNRRMPFCPIQKPPSHKIIVHSKI